MKTFLDTTLPLSKNKSLETKFFACFTSARIRRARERTPRFLISWAQSLGKLHIPFGVQYELEFSDQPVSGIVHLAGKEDSIRPGDRLGHELEVYADILAAYIQED